MPTLTGAVSTDSYDEEEADGSFVCALDEVCFGDICAAVDKRSVAAIDIGRIRVRVTEYQRSSSSVSWTSSCTSLSWLSVSSTSCGFYHTSAWHPGRRA